MKFLNTSIFSRGILIVLIAINHLALSQDEYKANVIPPSPDAAALGKFVEVPVSYYTGIPQISIPIYNIQSGTLQLPISISYHAGGVKVEDVASRVGLGWALNAGGVISRSVVGCQDEGDELCTSYWHTPDFDPSAITLNDKYDIAHSRIDTQPDMYFFNFGQYSGKLYIDKNGDCMTIPHAALKIEPGLGPKKRPDGSWVITSPDGKKFTFAAAETSRVATVCGTQITQQDRVKPYVSSWYLTQIEEPISSRKIILSYTDNTEILNYSIGTSESYAVNILGTGPRKRKQICSSFYNEFKPQRLEAVSFDGGIVKFNYLSGRKDLEGASMLSSIEIQNSEQTFHKKFNLKHGYFTTECGKYYQDCFRLKLVEVHELSDNGFKKAPYKFRYNEFQDSELNLPARNSKDQDFWGYYNARKNLTTIPYIYTNGIDLMDMTSYKFYPFGNRWVNPEATGAFSLEEIHYPTGGYTKFTFEQNQAVSEYLKNKPIPENVELNSNMEETEVSFSVNCYHEPGAVATVSYYKSVCDPESDEEGNETIELGAGVGSGSSYFDLIGSPPGGGTDIPIDNIGGGGAISIIGRYGSGALGGGSGSMVVIPPSLLPPISGIAALPANIVDDCNEIDRQIEGVPCEEPNYCPIITIESNEHSGAIIASDASYRIFLPNGNYKLKVHNPLPQFDYKINLDYENEIDSPNKYAGGLRIKRISQYDPDRDKVEVKNDFNYEEDGLSTGTIMFYPNASYYLTGEVHDNTQWQQRIWGAASVATMAATKGSQVGYKKVSVLNGQNGVNGKTEYFYTSFDDYPDVSVSTVAPYSPSQSKDWKRGLLDRQIIYRRSGDARVADSEHPNGPGTGHSYSKTYETDPNHAFLNIGVQLNGIKLMVKTESSTMISGDRFPLKNGYEYYEGWYAISSGWSEMDYSIDYLYSDQYPGDEQHAKIVRTDYKYNPTNLQVQQVTTSTSDSEDVKKSIILYSCDYASDEGDFIEELNKNHIINLPVETVELVETTRLIDNIPVTENHVVGGMLFTYKPEGTGLKDDVYTMELAKPMPFDEFSFSNQNGYGSFPFDFNSPFSIDNSYSLVHQFHVYDEYGNLLQESGRDGTTTDYEWDASKFFLYPNRKIVNKDTPSEQVTEFGYKLLVGLTSQTDPNGKTITYQYDGLGRLKAILDHEDNLVKAYEYQYKAK